MGGFDEMLVFAEIAKGSMFRPPASASQAM